MERLDSILPRVIDGIPAPEFMVRFCPIHGELKPIALGNRWVVRSCPCDRVRKTVDDFAKMQSDRRAHQKARTYTWLGERWNDLDLHAKTFEDFDHTRDSLAYLQVQAWCIKPRGNAILHGLYGLGKTHLLAATANELGSRGVAVLFATAYKLFDAIQWRISHDEDHHPLLDEAKRALVLIIDDVDKVKPTDWKLAVWHDLVDDRVNRGLPTALSTNKFHELETYLGASVRDRLRTGAVEIEFLGESYRREL